MGEKVRLKLDTRQTILDTDSGTEEEKDILVPNAGAVQYIFACAGNTVKKLNFYVETPETQLEILGICLAKDNDNIHLETKQVHNHPYSSSECLIKTVLMDKSKFFYRGLIKIDKEANQTNAFLTQNSLLLSDEAQNRSIPSLEIEADDVKASHAATTGNVDEKQIFYLRSRGIDATTARELVIYGYCAPITRKIRDERARDEIINIVNMYFGEK